MKMGMILGVVPTSVTSNMPSSLARWTDFLAIDAEVVRTLGTFPEIIEPHMDAILDRFYERILTEDTAIRLFQDSATLMLVRRAQRRHWIERVFAGRFDAEYRRVSRAMGQSHFRAGVDAMLFTAAYCLVLNEVAGVIVSTFRNDPVQQQRYLSAVNLAVFLDLGLATSVYYEDYLADVEDWSRDLNHTLARAEEYGEQGAGLHLARMSGMCRALAIAAGQEPAWADLLLAASPLYDLIKSSIPESILLRPGSLDASEHALMRRRPQLGVDAAPSHRAAVIRMARRVGLSHHERWDGNGYPTGLCGEEIPLEGRIVAICHTYDALLCDHPHQKAWNWERTVRFIRENSGVMFDPRLIDVFLAILPEIEGIRTSYADVDEAATADRAFPA